MGDTVHELLSREQISILCLTTTSVFNEYVH